MCLELMSCTSWAAISLHTCISQSIVQHYGACVVYVENKPGLRAFFIPLIPSVHYAKSYTLCVYFNSLHSVLIVGHMMSMAATSYIGIKRKLLLVQEKLYITYILDAIKILSQNNCLGTLHFVSI
jgi:hypothetical protein